MSTSAMPPASGTPPKGVSLVNRRPEVASLPFLTDDLGLELGKALASHPNTRCKPASFGSSSSRLSPLTCVGVQQDTLCLPKCFSFFPLVRRSALCSTLDAGTAAPMRPLHLVTTVLRHRLFPSSIPSCGCRAACCPGLISRSYLGNISTRGPIHRKNHNAR